MLRSLQHPVNSHFCTYTHLLPGVVDTFSHTHTVRDTLVGSCTISEEEEEEEESPDLPVSLTLTLTLILLIILFIYLGIIA